MRLGTKCRLEEDSGHITFWCPGCGQGHTISVESGRPGANWGWNGNLDAPTFTPSILTTQHKLVVDDRGEWHGEWATDSEGNGITYTCHSFVTDGQIQFLSDCTHPLSGQTVPLPDIPPALRDPVDKT